MVHFWSRKALLRLTAAAIIVCLLGTTLLMIFNITEKDKRTLEKQLEKIKNPIKNENVMLAALRKEVDEQIERLKNPESEIDEILTMSGNKSRLKFVLTAALEKPKQNLANDTKINEARNVNYNVHIFYYPWYGNPTFDGKYLHWNHPFLPHWNHKEAKKWPSGHHSPPDDIGANFYPELGPYSSKDPGVVRKHIQDIKYAGIGVIAVSWYPPGDADSQGEEPDKLMPMILDMAAAQGVKVAFHIEPYKGRDHLTLKKNLKYIIKTYGNHSAFYRRYHKEKNKMLPLYYVYDAYQVSSKLWADLFKPSGKLTLRDTELDGFFIGLLVEQQHKVDIVSAGFDGFYTYFATNGFTFGSSWDKWKEIQKFAKSQSKMFIPSVGPGYIDTNVRPWNGKNTRNRNAGNYYRAAFDAAFKVNPSIISITSFNEWHEGTQIEPAVSKNTGQYLYLDYGRKQGPRYYLDLTREFADRYTRM
ncbi:glycoprotein endo-alpha-1,2-mannosidase-like [Mizuhopecten yessoensis]|uniref:glycoprotein endo-alpha-1,2-mannosidase-like n=1 Tax=Mizuhopecten yessoensis TaxID=6573 RepID=UPI000B45E6A6|nr:glycoprotein endo-alpha-1,2-mannosidase-like [Mizuhopecten yessoensis]XP_021380064.1 glycoprotein endo-alpha-1,2-mannosidase-like [Mizuhopecten yessoensis]